MCALKTIQHRVAWQMTDTPYCSFLLFTVLSILLYLTYPLSWSQVWNVRSAPQLCQTPSWTGGGLVVVRWMASIAVTHRMRVQYQMSSHQGEPCLLHSTDPKGKGNSGATHCVKSATSNSTLLHRPRFTTMANPTRKDSSKSAMARCQATQVGLEWCSSDHVFVYCYKIQYKCRTLNNIFCHWIL